jgi:hypothetical protein
LLTDSRIIKYKIETSIVYPFDLVQVVESGQRVLNVLGGYSRRESTQMENTRDTGCHRRDITLDYVVFGRFQRRERNEGVEGSKLSLPLVPPLSKPLDELSGPA